MKFDTARASAIFEKLGDPAFTGPHSEGHIADFVAGELARMGWKVEQREVTGSRFPQRVGPWIGWLGYGALVTAGFLLTLESSPLSIVLVFVLFLLTVRWIDALLSNRIRLGRRRRPLDTAPLVIGTLAAEPSPPVRVVFQAVLGGLKTDFFQSFSQNRYFVIQSANVCIWALIFMTTLAGMNPEQYVKVTLVSISSVPFFLVWVMILCILSWEYHQSRSIGGLDLADRRGLAVLIELARSWPRDRSRQIEPVFIAAGGQRIDYAGSREVVRIVETEWPRKPTLLVLFFAPGAGEAIRIAPGMTHLQELANESAKSLWIPIWGDDCWTLSPFWPLEEVRAEPIALIGSEPTMFFESAVSPEALHRAAQLATEIALRWAKKKKELPAPPEPPPAESEPFN